jgi:hypothetical protein
MMRDNHDEMELSGGNVPHSVFDSECVIIMMRWSSPVEMFHTQCLTLSL